MKARVIKTFKDKEKKVLRQKGDEFTCTKERFEVLKKAGVAEAVEPEEETGKEAAAIK